MADLAVVKLEPRRDLGSIQWGNYSAPACLPNEGELPDEGCQVLTFTIRQITCTYVFNIRWQDGLLPPGEKGL